MSGGNCPGGNCPDTHLKAPPRKQNLRGRRRRHTAILTDSLERDAIYEEEKKREERKKKKVDCLSQKSKKMKKVYAQDKKVVKEEIQGKKAKEKTDTTLRSSKKNLEQSSSVSGMFSIIYAWNHIPRVPQEKSGGGVLYANLGLTSIV